MSKGKDIVCGLFGGVFILVCFAAVCFVRALFIPPHEHPIATARAEGAASATSLPVEVLNVGLKEPEDLGWLPIVYQEGRMPKVSEPLDSPSGLIPIMVSVDPKSDISDTAKWRTAVVRVGGFNPDKRSYPQISYGAYEAWAHVKKWDFGAGESRVMYFVADGEKLGDIAYTDYLREHVIKKEK
jgi:hypothetical protein